MRATSATSTRFSPVSTYAGNLRFRKSTTIRPVGVGLASPAPIGVVGFRIITCCPARAAWIASCSAMNFDRLYGPIISSSETGVVSSTIVPSALNPIVATLDV